MDVLLTLRELAFKKCPSIKVNLVKPPTYVSVFYSPEEKPSEVIFIYKEVKEGCNGVANDVKSNQGDGTPGSEDYEFDITGNPLENPFEELNVNISIVHERQHVKMWYKSEENHLPLSLNEARSLFNSLALQQKGRSIVGKPIDIWALTKPNARPELDTGKKRHDVLLGLRHSKAIRDGKLCWFARSSVILENPCSLGSPEMDPTLMKKDHLKLCGASMNVTSKVLSVYNLSGEVPPPTDSIGTVSCSSSGSVQLEVKWREPKLEPPLHESSSDIVIQAVLGQSSNTLHPLWTQLWTLEKLLRTLGTTWKDWRSVEKLPKYRSAYATFDVAVNEHTNKLSVSEQLKGLFSGGFSSQYTGQNDTGFAASQRTSVLSNRTTMHKSEDSSAELKLKRNIERVLSGKRLNADGTDDLWTILSDCDTYNDLSNAFDTIYREVKQRHWKPHLRHRNQSRTSALLKAFSSTINSDTPDLTVFESSGISFALESLFELGLEKLAHDYSYIFMESDLASRDELLSPPFPRKGLGISQDAWLSNCDEYLTWLMKLHASLEVTLLTEDSLSEAEQAFSSVTSQALSYFQGANSPIQSAKFINSNEHCLTFRATVNAHQIGRLLSKPFDLWQLTLTTETPTQTVETVFHRSTFQVFPPQILSGDPDTYIPETGKSSYCSCKFITLCD